MKASAFEFRIRILLHAVIFTLGLWAPWNRWLHLDPPGVNAHVWGLLSANLASAGWMSLSAAFNFILALGIACALLAALLRTWGSAYLGADIVQAATMHTATGQTGPSPRILEDGPYRYLRNPLYVGTLFHTLALSLLMPRSGAVFAIIATAILQLRLVLGEEAFLGAQLGESYRTFCARVPRFIPAFRAHRAFTAVTPRWGQAFLGELYMWGVAASFSFAGWRYNAVLLIQCVVVSFGASLILRATLPARRRPASAQSAQSAPINSETTAEERR